LFFAQLISLIKNNLVKASHAAETIAAKAAEAKNSTVSAAHTAASTVQGRTLIFLFWNKNQIVFLEKTNALVDSGKQALASNAQSTTEHITQEVEVTPVVADADEAIVAAKPPKTSKGPIHAVRKFFIRLFNPSRRQAQTKTTITETVQTTETVAATNNSLESS